MTLFLSRLVPALLCALLAACSLAPPARENSTVYYDLSAANAESGGALRSLDVVPSSWLAGTAMHYRLAYADANRREHYAGSRWSGQPAELLSMHLQRSLMSGSNGPGAGCRLRLDLDDFTQVFDSAQSSRMLLEGRATLYGTQQIVLARRIVSLSQPAGADAAGGVAASGPLTAALIRELREWIAQECRKPG
ncbi:MAG: membrane integrity-associated transporter subunit PqiC [Rhodocyclaceae bacterium]|nr:membrane integrity-associated transporter subunit PqiC [Rhodocyclaceae bacterium]